MAVEDDDIGDREVWTKASRLWSSTTSAGPTTLTKRGQPFNTPALEVLTSAHSSFPSKFWCSRFRFRFQFQLPFFSVHEYTFNTPAHTSASAQKHFTVFTIHTTSLALTPSSRPRSFHTFDTVIYESDPVTPLPRKADDYVPIYFGHPHGSDTQKLSS
ncbi:hypothetical protein BDZ45DRAFT_105101 [Acephala macrosclerotiorum]|nr:hypothetical protein BDZ45DRAFT_105101 [Acephala macrosclerotiorum]